MKFIGKSVYRKESWEKVTGKAKYTNDDETVGMLDGKLVTSPYAHAKIVQITISDALKIKGVRAIITGDNLPLTGEEIRDRPPVAVDRVRYYGEVVAIVVADSMATAQLAANQVQVAYDPLPVVNSPREALHRAAPLLHEQLGSYHKIEGVYPVPGTNIASKIKIRKGNMQKGWEESDVTVLASYSFHPSDHAAMETRCSLAQIHDNGIIEITSSSQAPFMIKKLIAAYFQIPSGNIIVKTPLVGGGYGGKASIQLEILAYIASKAVNGRLVKIANNREEDMVTAPGHIGLDATIKLGCTKNGLLKAAELLYLWDSGAYSDKSTDLARAGAVDCTGPYRIEHIYCDSLSMYTNHPYPGPFRGFSHSEVHFAFERTMDMLANKLNMDPLEFRYKNAIRPGDTSPSQVKLNTSNVGNVRQCLSRLKELIRWDEGRITAVGKNKVRAKGISCLWKNSTIDTNSSSGVILMFNPDGSINIISGVVEIGTGTKTILAQMLSEKLKMPVENIHVQMTVHTQHTPEHWKTVASRGTFMAGRALLNAADDVIFQLKERASCILLAPIEDLEVGYEKIFLRDDPTIHIAVKEIAYGYTFPSGISIGGQIIGSGTYTLRHMTKLNKETGAGKHGPEWTVGAQGVEVEVDTRTYEYRLVKAISVIDIGKVLNQKAAEGQVTGAMSMGLSFAGRETFIFDQHARVLNPQLRTYQPIRYGEQPEYIVDFVESLQIDAPYGARGVGEHGLIGMPAALANALSTALQVDLHHLPLTPELLWRTKERRM
ncbi:CO/xanthine dehydrogenase Mo-binding subunit [Bacillus thermophilus]|uniref:CO/xanthine dehydrogenase Mo-binding subunit n=1 Tax=Siminovitchia thermophila TaxID=1245522 RepID=A0ABS2R9U0_9BACI|nr:xanthine dehydrogenase family protein molybdopterin-binding subunit [Siminovitchia thermophila]MBM7716130.1 CO/xanthine dehydrogenase Mo-binding subunit [Siminovitchia thermophila]ONK22422.1 aldehyde oxidase [Bacillus sp. VT-16-64]